jgi:hypothetical protein
MTRTTIVYAFPMVNYMAQLVLPYDLTSKEAKRLMKMIKCLPMPSKQPRDKNGRFA